MSVLSLKTVSCQKNGKEILKNISLDITKGDFVGIIGPNGAGKTTMLRTIIRLAKKSGSIFIGDKEVEHLKRGEMARLVAMVPQRIEAIDWFTAEEMITIGRTPYLGMFAGTHPEDKEKVNAVLRLINASEDRGRILTTLSGGEMQRILIGRALAQEPEVLLLDQPTAHLDIKYQIEILKMLKDLIKVDRKGEIGAIDTPQAIVSTFHNINMAADYCNRLVLLSHGEMVAQGLPEEVLTAENMRKVYGIDVYIDRHPKTGRPHYFIQQ